MSPAANPRSPLTLILPVTYSSAGVVCLLISRTKSAGDTVIVTRGRSLICRDTVHLPSASVHSYRSYPPSPRPPVSRQRTTACRSRTLSARTCELMRRKISASSRSRRVSSANAASSCSRGAELTMPTSVLASTSVRSVPATRSANSSPSWWSTATSSLLDMRLARLTYSRVDWRASRARTEVPVTENERKRRVRRLPREVRERQITDAAVEVFSRHGFHNASMDEVAEVAGVSKPMVYAYLGSKEELFAACIQREAQRLLQAIAEGVRGDVEPDMQLWTGLRSFFHFVGQNRSSWTVLHRQALSVGGEFAEEISQMRARSIELVAALVVASGTRKGVGAQAEKSGEALAAALVGAAESLADWWLD